MRASRRSSGPSNCSKLTLYAIVCSAMRYKLHDSRLLLKQRINSVYLSREKRCFFHIRKSEKLLCESFNAHTPTTVRMHSVFKCHKIEEKIFRIKPLAFHFFHKQVMVVNSLPASCDFNTTK